MNRRFAAVFSNSGEAVTNSRNAGSASSKLTTVNSGEAGGDSFSTGFERGILRT
jgi:hypothetical protein